MNTKILIISFSNLDTDPRVNRQIRFLKDNYEIHTIGFNDSKIDTVVHSTIAKHPKNILQRILSASKLFFGFYTSYYEHLNNVEQAKKYLINNSFDLIVANDIDTLPLVLKYKKNAKIIFDAHEYAPKEVEDKLLWRIFFQRYRTFLCKQYIPLVNRMITVCDGIADEYYKNFGVNPIVITNAPKYESNLQPTTNNQEKIKIIHHGGAIDSRKIELMIEAMHYVDSRFELYLMLIPSQIKYFHLLKNMAKSMKNVFFIDTVPMEDIAKTINQYDIGFYLLEPNSFNNKHALPNKFFEFIQARLCVVIGPSIEMANIVNQYNIGVVSDSFKPQEMAKLLNALDYEKIMQYKTYTNEASFVLSAESNRNIFLDLVIQTLEEK